MGFLVPWSSGASSIILIIYIYIYNMDTLSLSHLLFMKLHTCHILIYTKIYVTVENSLRI